MNDVKPEEAAAIANLLQPKHTEPVPDPEDPDTLLVPGLGGMSTYPIELGPGGDSWCLMCEALDTKPWRFTEEQAARINWLICDDHQDLTEMQLVLIPAFMIEALVAVVRKFAPEKPEPEAVDDIPAVMDIPSAD